MSFRIIRSPEAMSLWSRRARSAGKRVAFVPTMGALHAGHLSLIAAARRHADAVAVSVFVNPLQFGPSEDFKRYPRNLLQDARLIRSAGAGVVFAPAAQAMYPAGFSTAVDVQPLDSILEGAVRPGHFRGVATVVAKLLNIVQPGALYLGRKDFQQAALLNRLCRDLAFPVAVRVMPTVRERDGLAMSSRNAYLSTEARRRATVIYRALREGAALLRAEPNRPRRAERRMSRIIENAGLAVDYARVADPSTLLPARSGRGRTVMLVAARLEKVRLIDNLLVDVS